MIIIKLIAIYFFVRAVVPIALTLLVYLFGAVLGLFAGSVSKK